MSPIAITVPKNDLAAICLRHRVRALWVFGSAACSHADARPFRPDSDIDFLVEFEDLPEGEIADAYFGLREALGRMFDRGIDLVTTDAIRNPYFANSVRATKVPLYVAA